MPSKYMQSRSGILCPRGSTTHKKRNIEEIDAEVGSELDWYDGDRRNGPNVTLFTCGSIDDPPERQEEIRAWMSEKLLKFKDVFNPRLEKIIAELEDA